ncbi:alpha/beta-hydrolase [Zopfia rhizophila CBS 207.26]|uniref:Alpha/beta-hydrolase n=1 Tax=Zopfia rhizophila CBS 207.26 TaxID=1314779 RepID=A0A6A6EA72_9PEZI|nr:alpha/beta-hydrolase [Zopfia rhizophila CBS 207.26]
MEDRVDRLAAKSVSDLKGTLTSGAGKSSTCLNNVVMGAVDHSASLLSKKSTQALNQGAALCDLISSRLDAVITSMDGERFSGDEKEFLVFPEPYEFATAEASQPDIPRGPGVGAVYPSSSGSSGSNHFSKVWLYANSRLPPHLPPFKIYMPTYPLLCLAAQYSERVYTKPRPHERESHVDANWRSGTKAMVLKSVPIDDMNTIVFAIRGSQTFMDWAVNFRPAPDSPKGFLDDEGNACHSGFLQVARQMIKPVAERLRMLLQENPGRTGCSLLITGHSAGGAVAALLYAHMMSTHVKSDLNYLTGFFKRVHCITFGAPPVSLLPLQKPDEKRHRKSLFYSFINEGDPVPRADKNVVRSLLRLYASPAPSSTCTTLSNFSKLNLSSSHSLQTASSKPSKHSKFSKTSTSTTSSQPVWKIPPSTLSTAGRLVVLRQRRDGFGRGRGEKDIEAVTVTDEQLRNVVFGDPMAHMMRVYARRVEVLATRAVTVQGY